MTFRETRSRYKVPHLLLGVLLVSSLLAGCNRGGGGGGGASLVSLEVTPTNPSIALGFTKQFNATGVFSDNTTQDLTTQVTWSSSNGAVATVSTASGSEGLATALSAGTTTVTAASGSVSGNTTFTVTAAVLQSIEVTPTNPSIAAGFTQPFTATGVFNDNTTQDLTTQVTWSSSNTAVATISTASGSEGLATALSAGTTTVTAASGSVSGNTTFTVTAAVLQSIAVTPANPSIALGFTQPFTATGVLSDNTTQDLTTQVTWSSSNTGVATISNAAGSKGEATSVGAGSTTVTAASGSVSGSTTLKVTAATLVSVAVTPTNPSIVLGFTQPFTATGVLSDNTTQDLTTQVTWSSSNTGVATISNAAGSKGEATSVGAGSTTVTAASGSVSGSTTLKVTAATLVSVAVTPTKPSIAAGFTQPFTATGVLSDNTTQDLTAQVTWSSSDGAVATVSNASGSEGLATALSEGMTTVTATSGSVSGSTTLTVTAAVLQSIEVAPTNPSIAAGFTQPFTATGIFSDGSSLDLTTQVTWSSSNTSVATVSNASGSEGLATALSAGTTTVTATSGSVSGSTTFTVTAALLQNIKVDPANPEVPVSVGSFQFFATGIFSDGSSLDLTTEVTWSSSNPGVATISNTAGSNGRATAVAAGPTIIKAIRNSISGSTQLLVTSATLDSIEVTPTNPLIGVGTTRQFVATGRFNDGTVQDLTTLATWNSSDGAVATISNAANSKGLATGTVGGSATITATFGAVSGQTTLTVTGATLVSIEVTPADPTIGVGTTRQFVATAHYSDLTTQNMTDSVTWSSSDAGVATISNAAGKKGLATGTAGGSATITATFGAVSGQTTLTVTGATLDSIEVKTSNDSIGIVDDSMGVDTVLRFFAIGHYSDTTTQGITDSVTWSASDAGVATISNANGNKGLATGIAGGSATITATFGLKSGSTTLTVTGATLVSIDVMPANPSVSIGTGTKQFVATGHYSDLATQNMTDSATWSSSDGAVAMISNAGVGRGLATLVGEGSTIVTATFGAVSGQTTLMVTP